MAYLRIWKGRVPGRLGDEYKRFLVERAIPDYSSVDGLKGIIFAHRDVEGIEEFILITIWDSIEAMP